MSFIKELTESTKVFDIVWQKIVKDIMSDDPDFTNVTYDTFFFNPLDLKTVAGAQLIVWGKRFSITYSMVYIFV